MVSITCPQSGIQILFDTDKFTELWDRRRGSHRLHAEKPPDTMTSPNSSQDRPPGEPDPGTKASNGTGLVHQYLWQTEGHPMLYPQPAADQSQMAQPMRMSSTATADTAPPINAFGQQYQAAGNVGSGEVATDAFGPVSPVTNGGGAQSPLRPISSTPSSMRNPSNQASLQSPGLWTEAPSESTHFLPNSPPRSNSNFSRTAQP